MCKMIAMVLLLSVTTNAVCFAVDVPAGIVIPVELMTDASEAGAQATYRVTADVLDKNGKIIVPSGATGVGRVIQRRNGIIFGGPGKTEVSLETLNLSDGTKMGVNAKHTRYGADVRVATILLTSIYAGFLIKGGGGKLNQGSKFTFTTN
ncbi:hypothetical protein [Armatimonas sp.]|uniref:hypothetical protein n=1 Tax=Armatimonas sp. TaxID=1872638 RepID=UPI00375096B5